MLKPFELYVPNTLDEAFGLMETHKDAKVLAGGSDIFVMMHKGQKFPCLIDIKSINELRGMEYDEASGLKIGALTTIAEIENSAYVKKYYPALTDAVSRMACLQVRSKGTIAGNICNASPAADTAGPLYLYDAVVKIASRTGIREVPITDFFTGPKTTCLKPGELVVSISLPAPTPNSGSAYMKLMKRGALEIGIMSTGVKVACDSEGKCVLARISLSAVAPTPVRVKTAEEFLIGKKITEENIVIVTEYSCGTACPNTWRNSEEWSKDMVNVYIPQTMELAISRMQKGAF